MTGAGTQPTAASSIRRAPLTGPDGRSPTRPRIPVSDLLTAAEAARLLGISAVAVRKAARKGWLPGMAGGRGGGGFHGWRFTRAAVDAYAANRGPRPAMCVQCGTSFTRSARRHRYCSKKCANLARSRAVAGMRPDGTRAVTCEHCGTPLVVTTSRRRFCSTTCRVLAFYARHGYDRSAYEYAHRRRAAS